MKVGTNQYAGLARMNQLILPFIFTLIRIPPTAIRQFPQLEQFIKTAKVKNGARPYVSDGILLLGKVDSFSNLMVSCGPGSNGWKLAMGSGEIVERLVSGKTESEITKELGFDAHAFSPAGRVLQSPLFSKLCRARWGVEEEKDH